MMLFTAEPGRPESAFQKDKEQVWFEAKHPIWWKAGHPSWGTVPEGSCLTYNTIESKEKLMKRPTGGVIGSEKRWDEPPSRATRARPASAPPRRGDGPSRPQRIGHWLFGTQRFTRRPTTVDAFSPAPTSYSPHSASAKKAPSWSFSSASRFPSAKKDPFLKSRSALNKPRAAFT
ncbi:hypothetical protein DIPPA_17191 [Diplonema papillatum]|nr:hypothetical protein DIPPA_17191 [Diplonema papillatum]